MEWDYAMLSKSAKELGGPEMFKDALISSGKNQMVPTVILCSLLSGIAGVGVKMLADHIKEKKQKEKRAAEELSYKESMSKMIEDMHKSWDYDYDEDWI